MSAVADAVTQLAHAVVLLSLAAFSVAGSVIVWTVVEYKAWKAENGREL